MNLSCANNTPIGRCKTCNLNTECRDSAASWFLLFVGLIATIAIRAVNLVIDISSFWAKALWYIGITGFLLYFLYKFRQDRRLIRKIEELKISAKLAKSDKLNDTDYQFLSALMCKLRSRKDAINYFFIFFTSALALLLGIYNDLLK